MVYRTCSEEFCGLHYRRSSDNGGTWPDQIPLQRDGDAPTIAATSSGLVLAWRESDQCFEDPLGACEDNIWYKTSDDAGVTWSAPVKYTQFLGRDFRPSITGIGTGGFALAWASNRHLSNPEWTSDRTVWFGNPEVNQDIAPPPAVLRLEHRPVANPQEGDEVTVMARVVATSQLVTLSILWHIDGVIQNLSGLSLSPDGILSASLASLNAGDNHEYHVVLEDADGNVMTSFSRGFQVQPAWVKSSDVLLVIDDFREDVPRDLEPFYRDALNASGTQHDFWDASLLGPPDAADLALYRDGAVIWSAPHYEPWLWRHPDRDKVTSDLAAFLDSGGSLFITGQEISQHFTEDDDGRAWLEGYLHARHVNCCAEQRIGGVAEDVIGDGLGFGISGGDGANNSYSPDEIDPVSPAQPVLRYVQGPVPAPAPGSLGEGALEGARFHEALTGLGTSQSLTDGPHLGAERLRTVGDHEPREIFSSGTAALRVDTGTYRLVYFAFNFESIDLGAVRAEVMGRVMAWLNPSCNGLSATIDGTDGPDVLFGTPGDDVIVGLGGDDIIFGLGGNDVICGGAGEDIIDGGDDGDWISGGFGVDIIRGDSFPVALGPSTGDLQRDTIFGGPDDDLIAGGVGNDLIYGNDGNDQLGGGDGNDLIFGNEGDDRLLGDDGDDTLVGHDGNDTIDCGNGYDIANGGPGTDTVTVSCELRGGAESIRLSLLAEGDVNVDRVVDVNDLVISALNLGSTEVPGP